jgi:hypothetical protein
LKKSFVVDCKASHAPLLSPRHHLQINDHSDRSLGVQTDENRKVPDLGCGLGARELPVLLLKGVDGVGCHMRARIV